MGYWKWLGRKTLDFFSNEEILHFVKYCLFVMLPSIIFVAIICYLDFPRSYIFFSLPLIIISAIIYFTYGDYKEEHKNPTKR